MNKKGMTLQMTALLIIGMIVFILLFLFITETDVLAKIKAILPDFSSGNNDYPSGGNSDISSSTFLEFNNKRSSSDVLKTLNYGEKTLKKCSCGSNCVDYANWIIQYSKENNIPDPLLLASLMMQESSCDMSRHTTSSYGLMQININDWCGTSGFSEDLETCKDELLENPEDNIRLGAEILKKKYDIYKNGKTFSGACSEKYKKVVYTEWQAAIRGYNGWGCNKNYPQQDKFVEEVVERYNKLNLALQNE